ncbi:MAG: redoxin domain-containing protein [Chromatiales bacterium]
MRASNSTLSLIAAVTLGVLTPAERGDAVVNPGDAPPAPEFTHQRTEEWINSPPLRLQDLRGSVVLLDFWTFDCWNCYRSFPWLRTVEARYAEKGLKVIGVHSPEFDHEKVRESIVKKVQEFMLDHPVMIDNDFSYWKAMRNRYWPAFFLIDKQGRVRAVHVGETHKEDGQAREIERDIETLLAEPS